MEIKQGIYKYYFIGNEDWVYIGKSKNIDNRINTHKKFLLANKKCHNLANKLFLENANKFQYEIVELIDDVDKLSEREQYWYDYYKSNKFNMFNQGRPLKNGFVEHTEKTKQKISMVKQGKMIGKKNHMFGKHHSEETKQKISKNKKGKPLSEETKQKISNSNKGHVSYTLGMHFTEETRKKMSELHKGEKSYMFGKSPSPETRKKMSISTKKRMENTVHPMLGKHHSDETRKKLSISHTGKQMPEETKKKISETMKLVRKNKKTTNN